MAAIANLALGDREFLEVRQRLRMAAEAWSGHHRNGDLLLPRGSRLSEGETALISRRDDLDSLTAEFVEASIKAEHDERYRKLRNSRRIAQDLQVLLLWQLQCSGSLFGRKTR